MAAIDTGGGRAHMVGMSDATTAMPATLAQVLGVLRGCAPELRRRGVVSAAVFGSVARGEAAAGSDVDLLIDLDPDRAMTLFDYAGIGLFLEERLGRRVDMADRRMLKPYLRAPILREAVDAF